MHALAYIRSKGTLTKWFDDKGFGFITPEKGVDDIFMHISALGENVSRRPQVGDTIFYYLRKDEEGKIKAYDAVIEGLASSEWEEVSEKKSHANRSSPTAATVIIVLIILTIAVWATVYIRHFSGRGFSLMQSSSHNTVQASARYSCTGKNHCSQMRSCEEATFYLRNCPGTKMDGDGDGIPCERQLCN